jgi:hypothetical protein
MNNNNKRVDKHPISLCLSTLHSPILLTSFAFFPCTLEPSEHIHKTGRCQNIEGNIAKPAAASHYKILMQLVAGGKYRRNEYPPLYGIACGQIQGRPQQTKAENMPKLMQNKIRIWYNHIRKKTCRTKTNSMILYPFFPFW